MGLVTRQFGRVERGRPCRGQTTRRLLDGAERQLAAPGGVCVRPSAISIYTREGASLCYYSYTSWRRRLSTRLVSTTVLRECHFAFGPTTVISIAHNPLLIRHAHAHFFFFIIIYIQNFFLPLSMLWQTGPATAI